MIAVSDLGKFFGPQTLFEGVSIQFNPGNRYGVVGANGSGKSTFLKILAGEEPPTSGTLSIPKRARLGVLRQDHFLFESNTIIEVAMMGQNDVWQAMVEKEKILAAADDDFDADRYSEVEEIILQNDGYALEARAGEILEGLGIPSEVHHEPLSTLSGGFKLRTLLAQVLAGDPDVLLLDEPTNHLDIISIRWLEKFLSTYAGAALVISHDHRFLDNVSTHILDVDYQTILLYPGNYSYFVEAKGLERERKEAENTRREKQMANHQAFVDRFRAKATKARQAQSKLRMIEKMADGLEELIPSSRRYPKFKFKQVRPSGKEVVTAEGVAKAFGDNKVLEGVDLSVRRGDRIAIIGPNGIGKSTLLKILMNRLQADEGGIEWGYETHPGYFPQDHKELFDNDRQTVESWLWEACPTEVIGFVRGNLAQVLFSGDDIEKRLGSLSGGEAARLLFARLSVTRPNVLVLDEPTNHLDLEAIDALIDGLQAYDGTLLFVSHDRWFVSKLATRIVEITPEGIRNFEGTFEEYLAFSGDDHLDAETVILKAKREKKQAKGGKPKVTDQADKRRIRRLEKERDERTAEIESAEARINAINEEFCDPTFFDRTARKRVQKMEEEQKKLKAQVEEAMARWEEIEEELGKSGA